MKMMDWRADPTLTKDAERVLKNKTVRAMIDVLTEERPTTRPLPTVGTNGYDHAYANGLETGWRSAVETFKSLGENLPYSGHLVATFNDDNKEE